eukprot:jgi/Botrbrau1/20208/Bobra.31_1s0005.1
MGLGRWGTIGALAAGLGAAYYITNEDNNGTSSQGLQLELKGDPPPRSEQLAALRKGTKANPFDILIIGGGATGTGCALDAATRGLRTALVEREDFSSGTSSKSTKLVHGGVRYLEKAVFNLDAGQLKLVFEALHERKRILQNAPHLSHPLPIMTPCYKWWEVPFYWAGLKAYDLVAGTQGLTMSRFVTSRESRREFPTLAARGPGGYSLKGTILYYDGQFNDSRLNVTLAATAAAAGASVLNYADVTKLLKDANGQVIGAAVHDKQGGGTIQVYAKQVINAAGPFCDSVRQLSDPNCQPMIMPSSGVHITLPDYYSPEVTGLIVPKTKDGRVVFMLPWLEATIAGTTDSSSEILMQPVPTEEEIQFILDAISEYLTVDVRRSDVMSAWSGIRPLAMDPNSKDTASASRDHVITEDPDGLITVTGGKWTTYRKMAEDAIDYVLERGRVPQSVKPCQTYHLPLLGAVGYHPALFTEIAQNYVVPHRPGAIDTHVAQHLTHAYGDRAALVTKIAEDQKLGKRLVRGHPMLQAEVVYAARHEYCETVEDFIARRTRLAFLDTRACEEAIPQVVALLAKEKGWSWWRTWREESRAKAYLKTFHGKPGEKKAPVKVAESASGIPAAGTVVDSAIESVSQAVAKAG